MYNKILKHLLSLFFVMVLLSIPGTQQTKKTPEPGKEFQKEEKLPENGEHRVNAKKQLEIKIY